MKHNETRGVASRGAGGKGVECSPWQQKNCQKSGEKRGNIGEKEGKKRKNQEQKANPTKVL